MRLIKRIALSALFITTQVSAQCHLQQLSNPSFEVGTGNVFGGWNQFGAVAETASLTHHGNRSAQLSGSNTGNWELSAVWQKQSSAPGETWEVKAQVGHLSSNPLSGADIRAIINVEWRDAGDGLISYDSFTVVDENTATDALHEVLVTSNPAPAGTVSTHILIGLLQSPAQETGAVVIDSVEVRETTGVQQEDFQWDDFPGGRSLDFSGHSWRVKGPGNYGPGPNFFSDATGAVWVDTQDQLHMTIRNDSGWQSTEIAAEQVMGYGDYRITTKGDLNTWADNVVFGFFHWQYPFCYEGNNPWNLHNEADVEISRWNIPGNDIAQFIVQPWQVASNINRFDVTFNGPNDLTTFAYRWLPDRIEYRAWHGGAHEESTSAQIHSWVYTGPYLPRLELARMHLNFWQLEGPPLNGMDHEIVLTEFVFEPEAAGMASVNIPFASPVALAILLSAFVVITISRSAKLRKQPITG